MTCSDVIHAMHEVAPSIAEETIESAFRAADKNSDGRVGFAEFVRIMQLGGAETEHNGTKSYHLFR